MDDILRTHLSLSTKINFLVNRSINTNYCNLPRHCYLCLADSKTNLSICEPCLRDLPWNLTYCLRCALPTSSLIPDCAACRTHSSKLDTVRACFHYGFPIAQLLHRYKYQHRRDAGKICANLADLYWQLLNTSLNLETINQVDVILPIPQSRNKWKQRGFSQTETLSKAIGKRSGIPVHSRWLSMDNRARPNQAALSRKDRIKNLKEAFTVKDRVAEQLNGLNVLLVDDVMTTGATLESVGMLLKQMNAAKVSAFCLARTPPPEL